MVEFEEYCDIYDLLPMNTARCAPFGQRLCKSVQNGTHSKTANRELANICLIASDMQMDDRYFEILVGQSDLDTLYQLKSFFPEEAPIAVRIRQRIELLERFGQPERVQREEVLPEKTFYQFLCEWIDKKGYSSDSDFYHYAGISRQRFSKLRNAPNSISREMAIHLAAALELNYDECTSFLQFAGYSLNKSSRRDQLISYVMRNKRYTFYEMEELLDLFHEKTFLSPD